MLTLATLGVAVSAGRASALPDPSAAEVQFLDLLNQVRVSKGLAALTRDPSIDVLARDWSTHMANVFDANGNVVIDSNAPTNCDKSALCHRPGLAASIGAIEAAWRSAGENIGTGGDVPGLHNAFVASPGHYANIIGNYNRVGVGVITRGTRIWITFDFLLGPDTPSAPAPAPAPPSAAGAAQRVASPAIGNVSAFPGGRIVPVDPRRVLDTRDGTGAPVGRAAAGSTVTVDLSGGADRPSGAIAVMLNVTATDPTGNGYLTVYPCGGDAPKASNLNYVTGATVPNSVAVPLGADGTVCIYTQSATNVVVDLTAWFTTATSAPGLVTVDAPTRLLDSRNGPGRQQTFFLPLSAAVPADAKAVVVNVTATDPSASGYLTVFPCGSPLPLASNLNFVAGQTVPNLVTVKIGADRAICLFAKVATHVVVDLMGWYSAAGQTVRPVSPARFLDTREGIGGWRGYLDGKNAIDLAVGGTAGVPADVPGVVLNVTITEAAGNGYLTVYPCGSTRPATSNLNFSGGQTVANLVQTHVGGGKVCFYASQPAQVIADLVGYTAT